MDTDPRTCAYSLDASDTIVATGDGWRAFARANGAPELENVIGHCVWEYVAGRTTQELYSVIFHRVRKRQEKLTLPFRCDSPDVFRFMELDIAPGEADSLQLVGRLLREQQRPHFAVLDRLTSRSSSILRMCSVCKRVQLEGIAWMDADKAVRRLDLFDFSTPPSLEYAVCEDCVRRVREPAETGSA